MTRSSPFRFFAFLTLCVGVAPAGAQTVASTDDVHLDADERASVIRQTVTLLRPSYVFPEVAEAMTADLERRWRAGEYDGLVSAREFADSLTSHLQAVSRDKHLRVRFSAAPLPEPGAGTPPTPEERERQARAMRASNFGVQKLEVLPGNVGYLELRGFLNPALEGAEDAIAAAMSLLTRTDALIVDLRRNGGGSPHMVALLSSYLFGEEPVHLNSLYFRPNDTTEEFWTRSELKGPRYGVDKPVYVLTSGFTFSAAEEFSYNLKALGRATIVGETTGGGAHPGGNMRVHRHLNVFIPAGRAINPITGDNWEGVGVVPDLAVKAEEALRAAHLAALGEVGRRATDAGHRQALDAVVQQLTSGEDLR